MKTVPFSDILAQVCQLSGLDKTTLNDKTFSAVRDMCARRINVIWDREEWPDAQRYTSIFPGNPITSATIISNTDTEMTIRLALDPMFPRIYLVDFQADAYRLNTIGKSPLQFNNPFYVLKSDGTRVAAENTGETFEYATATGERGLYITSIDIKMPFGELEYPSVYAGINAPLTTKVIFGNNKQLILQLESGSLQGLEVTSQDIRQTTRTSGDMFLVEEFPEINDSSIGGSVYQKEVSYLRVFTSSQKFVRYRVTPPRLFGIGYSATASYSYGSQSYYDVVQGSGAYDAVTKTLGTRGDFWNAIASPVPTGVAPANTSFYWKMEQIPYRFKDYLINGVAADFMRSEGRMDEANVLEQLAEAAVQQQIDVLVRQQGQVQKLNMVYTY